MGRRTGGFSLLEIVVVLAGIMIILAAVVMSWSSLMTNIRANNAMDQVIQQMRLARYTAVTDRRAIIVAFTTSPATIQISQVPAAGGAAVTLSTVPIAGAQFCTVSGLPDTPQGFGNSTAVSFVNALSPATPVPLTQFNADGTFGAAVGIPVNGTIFTCTPGQTNSARAVTILGATGRVRPYRWLNGAWQE
jgi:type II secretory pathway pseudopilin PulG